MLIRRLLYVKHILPPGSASLDVKQVVDSETDALTLRNVTLTISLHRD